MIGEHGDGGAAAAQLLPAFKLAGWKHTRHHARQNAKAGRVAGGEADDERLRLVPMGDAFILRNGVECVRASVGLAKAGQMVQVQHLNRVLGVKPKHLVSRRGGARSTFCVAPCLEEFSSV